MRKQPQPPPAKAPLEARYPRDQIPSIRRVMLPRDTNAFGTIFGGVILSEIDLAAAVEAHRHHTGRLVTVAMDGVVFRAPVHVGDCVSFFTETVHVGRTSVRVKVRVWAEGRFSTGSEVFVTEAEVTMVAVDEQGRKVPIAS
jgi:acyl-CoA thioesterase YciA